MLLYNNVRVQWRAMFGSAFELRVNYWVEVGLLSPPFSPRRHVSPSLSWKCVYTYTKYLYSHHYYDLQSSPRIQGLMMCPNSSMDMAKLLIVVS